MCCESIQGRSLTWMGWGGDVGVLTERKEVSKGIPEGNTAELMIMTAHSLFNSYKPLRKQEVEKISNPKI